MYAYQHAMQRDPSQSKSWLTGPLRAVSSPTVCLLRLEKGVSYMLAADTGGTFTDLVGYDRERQSLFFGKTLTRPDNLVDGVLECIQASKVALGQVDLIKHGTTDVINAFVQRAGARTALVTTRGFRDVLEIGRANRPIAFDLNYRRDPPVVPRRLCFTVGGRIDRNGRELEPLDHAELERLAETLIREQVEAVAVSFINAFCNPSHEQIVAGFLRQKLADAYITTGTELTREWYEFERASTAAANAYVGQRARTYLRRFETDLAAAGFSSTLYMMASNGGVLSIARAAQQPIAMLESGPIGGCIGAGVYAEALGLKKVVAFDMGGTTAKCALVENGRFEVQPTYYVGGYERGFPIRCPILDIVEVGAGGGSIASVDAQGRLHVGPRSAGSEPGPVAFGRGGIEPTVTDANVVLGRIGSGTFMGGALRLDAEAAHQAIARQIAEPLGYPGDRSIDRIASGILAIASATMAGAVKEITIERGFDIREFDLFVFGGGGPLHGASLARELHIPRVIVPPQPGNFSALGMLLADARLDDTRTFLRGLDLAAIGEMEAVYSEMERAIGQTLREEFAASRLDFERHAEMRYRGQKHTIRIPITKERGLEILRTSFDRNYRKRYGHADPAAPVEFVALRVTGYACGEQPSLLRLHQTAADNSEPAHGSRHVYFDELKARAPTAVYRRDALPIGFAAKGPAIIEDYGSTIVIEPRDRFEIGRLGEIVIHCD